VRVVAGEFRGRRLRAPRGMRTRPTADRVREAVFSMLGDVTGARVLDLYAGSGALGIEALSRGAASAVFVERDPRAVAAIRDNLRSLGLDEPVRRQDALRFLAGPEGPFDLVFCDPPYDSVARIAGPLSERLPASLAEGARMVTESDKRTPLELPFALLAERTYGDTRIAIHAFSAPRLSASARPCPDRGRPFPDPDRRA
jgi:16S rRNA (guanine966-N2)-methyltransferase